MASAASATGDGTAAGAAPDCIGDAACVVGAGAAMTAEPLVAPDAPVDAAPTVDEASNVDPAAPPAAPAPPPGPDASGTDALTVDPVLVGVVAAAVTSVAVDTGGGVTSSAKAACEHPKVARIAARQTSRCAGRPLRPRPLRPIAVRKEKRRRAWATEPTVVGARRGLADG
jgi:hypothetical protein